jgi:hypothetical protein
MAKHHIGLTDLLPFLEHISTNQFIIKVPDSIVFDDAISNTFTGSYEENLNDKLNFRQIAIASNVHRHITLTQNLSFFQLITRVYEPIIVDHLHFTQIAYRTFACADNLSFIEGFVYDNCTFLPDTLNFTQIVTPNHKWSNKVFTDTLVFNSNVRVYVIPTRGHQGL